MESKKKSDRLSFISLTILLLIIQSWTHCIWNLQSFRTERIVGEIGNLGACVAEDGRKALDCSASREPVNQDCTQNGGFQVEPSWCLYIASGFEIRQNWDLHGQIYYTNSQSYLGGSDWGYFVLKLWVRGNICLEISQSPFLCCHVVIWTSWVYELCSFILSTWTYK